MSETIAPKAQKPAKTKGPEKRNVVLERLTVVQVPVGDLNPNRYNPNRQSPHEFELLCRSIEEDGFTQPVIARFDRKEIVDGEHRWRACQALGYPTVPVVWVEMTDEQQRIATLRHNRARGSEDVQLAADVLKELKSLGAVEWAQDSLMMDDVEIQRLTMDLPSAEMTQEMADTSNVPESALGAAGQGLSQFDKEHGIDTSADRLRAAERLLNIAKDGEEQQMWAKDNANYRLILFFAGDEAVAVRQVLEPNPAAALLALCKENQPA